MTQYLIKVTQPATTAANRIATSILTFGSHFATHASWQQEDGMTTGTLVVETNDQHSAFRIVPPNMRSNAKIVEVEAPMTELRSSPSAFERAHVPYPLAA